MGNGESLKTMNAIYANNLSKQTPSEVAPGNKRVFYENSKVNKSA